MKKFLSFFLLAFLLTQNVAFSIDNSSETTTTTEQQIPYNQKVPDFLPPKDLSGPVFPMEDLIGKPNPETNKFLSEFVSMMGTLGLIISAILIFAWFLKRMVNTRQEQANTTSIIKVVERRSLSPKTAVYLLEVEGKSLIVAESVNGVTRLAEYDSPQDANEKNETQPKVPSAFSKLMDQSK